MRPSTCECARMSDPGLQSAVSKAMDTAARTKKGGQLAPAPLTE
jgi:hypothetical protein